MPYAKAYRLQDVTSNAIFNSFYVTFLKHLNQQPFDLLPRTTITLNPNAPPLWDLPPFPDSSTLMPPPYTISTIDPSNNIVPMIVSPSPIQTMLSLHNTVPSSSNQKPSLSHDTFSSLC